MRPPEKYDIFWSHQSTQVGTEGVASFIIARHDNSDGSVEIEDLVMRTDNDGELEIYERRREWRGDRLAGPVGQPLGLWQTAGWQSSPTPCIQQ